MVRQAFHTLCDMPTKLVSFSDDMDGMRKVPENVPNQEMLRQHMNKPLTSVPDPFGEYESFGHHNNAMLRRFLDSFGFEYEFISSTDCYKSGRFDDVLKLVMDFHEDILNIMLPSLREERQKTYSPFLPVCPKTGEVLQVKIEEYKKDSYTVVYKDPKTQQFMETPITGGQCKLQWKVDWAARWRALHVDYEMSGKDHIENVRLSGKICKALGGQPPENLIYELFLGEEGDKISKSKGNGLTIDEWLRYAPKESLSYYMFQSPKKAKRLYFDVIPRHVDEYLTFLNKFCTQEPQEQIDNTIWHIHSGNPPMNPIPNLSFNLLLNLASVANAEHPDILWKFISRYHPDSSGEDKTFWDIYVDHAVAYYQDFVNPLKKYRQPTEMEHTALLDLKIALENAIQEDQRDSESIQHLVFEVGKKHPFTDLRSWFGTLYEVLLGQKEGPRMGSFIAFYGLEETVQLIASKVAA